MRILLLTAALLLGGPGPAVADGSSPEIIETTVDLKLVETLLEEQVRLWVGAEEEFSPPQQPVTLREFSKGLSKEIARRMPRRDGWGTDLTIFGWGDGLVVVSAGEDRYSDLFGYLQERSEVDDGVDLDDAIGDDIYLIPGDGVYNGHMTDLERQQETMANLRSIGTCIEAFSIDNNVYPRQDNGLQPLRSIEDKLEPVYIRRLPLSDAWGNEFLMWGTEGQYVVMSLGADGVPDRPYDFGSVDTQEFPFGGKSTDTNADIVFANGQFVQWPEFP